MHQPILARDLTSGTASRSLSPSEAPDARTRSVRSVPRQRPPLANHRARFEARALFIFIFSSGALLRWQRMMAAWSLLLVRQWSRSSPPRTPRMERPLSHLHISWLRWWATSLPLLHHLPYLRAASTFLFAFTSTWQCRLLALQQTWAPACGCPTLLGSRNFTLTFWLQEWRSPGVWMNRKPSLS